MAKLEYSPGTHGCHEALHMAAFLANAVERELCEHPALEHHEDWLALARSAHTSLAALYQAIGSKHL